jgi:hypothetical protein
MSDLRSELLICSSFVEIAKQEIDRGESGLAESNIAQAEEVYAEAGPLVAAFEIGEQKQRLEWKLVDIRSQLDIVERRMKRPTRQRGKPLTRARAQVEHVVSA